MWRHRSATVEDESEGHRSPVLQYTPRSVPGAFETNDEEDTLRVNRGEQSMAPDPTFPALPPTPPPGGRVNTPSNFFYHPLAGVELPSQQNPEIRRPIPEALGSRIDQLLDQTGGRLISLASSTVPDIPLVIHEMPDSERNSAEPRAIPESEVAAPVGSGRATPDWIRQQQQGEDRFLARIRETMDRGTSEIVARLTGQRLAFLDQVNTRIEQIAESVTQLGGTVEIQSRNILNLNERFERAKGAHTQRDQNARAIRVDIHAIYQQCNRLEEEMTDLQNAYNGSVPINNAQLERLTQIENNQQQHIEQLRDLNGMIQAIDNRLGELPEEIEKAATVRESEESVQSMHEIFEFEELPQSTHRKGRNPSREPERERIPKEARTKIPEPFEGKQNKAAEIFMMKMESYFADYEAFTDDRRKMKTFLNNMKKGDAENWAQPLFRLFTAGSQLGELRSWETLKEAFLEFFNDPTKEQKAVDDIHKLEQKGSAQKYTNEFRLLAQDLGWDEKALIDRYKAGLKGTVRTWMVQAGIGRNPRDIAQMSLKNWMDLAIQTDDLLYSTRNFGGTTGGNAGSSNRQTEQGKAGNTSTSSDDWRVKESIIEKRKSTGACIKCGKKGHTIRKCFAKKWETRDLDLENIKGKAGDIKDAEEDDSTSTNSEN